MENIQESGAAYQGDPLAQQPGSSNAYARNGDLNLGSQLNETSANDALFLYWFCRDLTIAT